ncbi:MAG TPA: hypothetical protein ENN78_02175 [Candidatus Omnitrophica bacterium]|nr:hypothetical protein [Candidatus Omnitrophota bacterium]
MGKAKGMVFRVIAGAVAIVFFCTDTAGAYSLAAAHKEPKLRNFSIFQSAKGRTTSCLDAVKSWSIFESIRYKIKKWAEKMSNKPFFKEISIEEFIQGDYTYDDFYYRKNKILTQAVWLGVGFFVLSFGAAVFLTYKLGKEMSFLMFMEIILMPPVFVGFVYYNVILFFTNAIAARLKKMADRDVSKISHERESKVNKSPANSSI